MVAALLIHGPEHIKRTLEAIDFWLTEHEDESLRLAAVAVRFNQRFTGAGNRPFLNEELGMRN